MTISFAGRQFVGGVVVQGPFVHVPNSDASNGRVDLIHRETLERSTWVTPLLRYRAPTDVMEGSLVSVSSVGRMNWSFESILARNSSLHDTGERGTHLFTKISLSTLMEWLTIAPPDFSMDLPMYALELFPRQSALLPLPRV